MNMAVDVKRLNETTIDITRAEAESDRQRAISRRTQALLAAAGEDGQKRWAILKVAHRRENDVDKSLSEALIDHWLPLRKADETVGGKRRGTPGQPVWMLAWPGYIFVHMVDTPKAWAGLRTIKHITGVLGSGPQPFFVSDEMMLRIKAELATLRDVRKNAGVVFVEGEAVKVIDGPFASRQGAILQVGEGKHAGRALVEVMIFGRTVPVELELAQLAKG